MGFKEGRGRVDGWVWVGGHNSSPAGVAAVVLVCTGKCVHFVCLCAVTLVSAMFVHRAQRTRHPSQSRRALRTHTYRRILLVPALLYAVRRWSSQVRQRVFLEAWFGRAFQKLGTCTRNIMTGVFFCSGNSRLCHFGCVPETCCKSYILSGPLY